MLLTDKIALVTGSTHNIGLAIARAFAREGAKVVVQSRHEADAKKVAEEIGGDFISRRCFQCRTNESDVRSHRDKTSAAWTFSSIMSPIRARAAYSTSHWKNGTVSWRST